MKNTDVAVCSFSSVNKVVLERLFQPCQCGGSTCSYSYLLRLFFEFHNSNTATRFPQIVQFKIQLQVRNTTHTYNKPAWGHWENTRACAGLAFIPASPVLTLWSHKRLMFS